MMVIGRGLMSAPKLMLIDEMSLGLAPIVVNDLFRILKEIRKTGITILFVEQNVRKSIQEADRAYILENGRVVMCGNACELQEEEEDKESLFRCLEAISIKSFATPEILYSDEKWKYLSPIIMGILLGWFICPCCAGPVNGVRCHAIDQSGPRRPCRAGQLSFIHALLSTLNIDPIIGLLITAPILFGLGFVIQHFIMRRAFAISEEAPLIIAFGIALMIQNAIQIFTDPQSRGISTAYSMASFSIGRLQFPVAYLLNFLAALVVMVIFHLFLKMTYPGRAITAASQDKKAAQLMGINTKTIHALAFGIAMISAAVAGCVRRHDLSLFTDLRHPVSDHRLRCRDHRWFGKLVRNLPGRIDAGPCSDPDGLLLRLSSPNDFRLPGHHSGIGHQTPRTVRPIGNCMKAHISKLTYEHIVLILVALFLAVMPILPVPEAWTTYAFIFFIYLAMAYMWNLIAGYSGLISLCQPAFLGLAGYTLALGTWVNVPMVGGPVGRRNRCRHLRHPHCLCRIPAERRLFCHRHPGRARGFAKHIHYMASCRECYERRRRRIHDKKNRTDFH